LDFWLCFQRITVKLFIVDVEKWLTFLITEIFTVIVLRMIVFFDWGIVTGLLLFFA